MSEEKKSIFERALDMDDEVKWWMRQTKQELISEFVDKLVKALHPTCQEEYIQSLIEEYREKQNGRGKDTCINY